MKSWATPLAAATFIILAVTGTLIFFKIETGLIKPVHEWLSWALSAGVILHIAANWKAVTGYFSRKPAMAIIGTGFVVTMLAIFAPVGEKTNPRINMIKSLESSTIETVGAVAGQNSDTIIEKLGKRGIPKTAPSMTIREIAINNNKKEMEIVERNGRSELYTSPTFFN
ncbi:MAG: DUF4405 domain-containing protein [Chlorobium sp.]|nr:MAG: DUF4405 domain-containing protein [Chlorobium sp.]